MSAEKLRLPWGSHFINKHLHIPACPVLPRFENLAGVSVIRELIGEACSKIWSSFTARPVQNRSYLENVAACLVKVPTLQNPHPAALRSSKRKAPSSVVLEMAHPDPASSCTDWKDWEQEHQTERQSPKVADRTQKSGLAWKQRHAQPGNHRAANSRKPWGNRQRVWGGGKEVDFSLFG